MRHRREANVLARLDRRMLADIGLTRSDVQDAFSAPLWQDPTELLNERATERRVGRKAMRAQSLKLVEPGFQQPATNRPARHADLKFENTNRPIPLIGRDPITRIPSRAGSESARRPLRRALFF